MKHLLHEIQTHFANIPEMGILPVISCGNLYPAWVFRKSAEYGVFIALEDESFRLSEGFSGSAFCTDDIQINGALRRVLKLSSSEKQSRNEFAVLCSQFIDPGETGGHRKKICAAPLDWWMRWKDLVGNKAVDLQPHSVLGELWMVLHLLKKGKQPNWRGPDASTHDIESTDQSWEVKATIARYGNIVQISGQHQLSCDSEKKLTLVFLRFEEGSGSLSMNSLLLQLRNSGLADANLEDKLRRLGYPEGKPDRDRVYRLLEAKEYNVDEKFPRITSENFVGGLIPPNIVQLTYKIDLASLASADIQ